MQSLILSSDWSLANARACAEAIQFVYDNPCSIESGLAHGRVLDGKWQGPDGKLGSTPARVLAWKGSASLADWRSNFLCRRTVIGSGEEVHEGFLDAMISVWGRLTSALGSWHGPLFVTGHSRGAALALLSAQILDRVGYSVTAVYTFGGPRVFNRTAARNYDAVLGSRTFRIVNQEDGVPRVPPALPPLCALARWSRIWGYWHVGQEAFIPALGGMIMNPSLVFKLASDLAGTMREWSQGKVAQAMDHPMSRYVEATQKL